MTRFSWNDRIERAEYLAKTLAFASEVLRFYREVACFQKDLCFYLESTIRVKNSRIREKSSVLQSLDTALLLPQVIPLLALVQRVGPTLLADAAGTLARQDWTRWEGLILSCWKQNGTPTTKVSEAEMFFVHTLLQPYREHLASANQVSLSGYGKSSCPFCGGKPQVGVLRAEGYGAKRSLICWLCSTEWDYRRIGCPACGEDRSEQLPVYTTSHLEHVRVEACDTCQTYIKTVDLSKDGQAIPVVDELAMIPLDLWAQEKGYQKLQWNLLRL